MASLNRRTTWASYSDWSHLQPNRPSNAPSPVNFSKLLRLNIVGPPDSPALLTSDALLGLKPRSFVGHASSWYVSAHRLRPSPRVVPWLWFVFYGRAFPRQPATRSFQRTRAAVPIGY